MSREKVTWPGARIQKKGEGMPNDENNMMKGTKSHHHQVTFRDFLIVVRL